MQFNLWLVSVTPLRFLQPRLSERFSLRGKLCRGLLEESVCWRAAALESERRVKKGMSDSSQR